MEDHLELIFFQSVTEIVTIGWSRERGVEEYNQNLPLMTHKHVEPWRTGVRQTIPDVGDRETQGLRTLGNESRRNRNR